MRKANPLKTAAQLKQPQGANNENIRETRRLKTWLKNQKRNQKSSAYGEKLARRETVACYNAGNPTQQKSFGYPGLTIYQGTSGNFIRRYQGMLLGDTKFGPFCKGDGEGETKEGKVMTGWAGEGTKKGT